MGVGHYSGLIKNGHRDYWKWPRTEDGETQFVDGYATTIFTNEAIDWIGEQNNPWFLWLAYTAPHPPIHLPPAGLHTNHDLSDDKSDIMTNPLPYYLAMLEALDSELGRLLSSLSLDQRKNTVVIFVGDNGTPDEGVQPPYVKYRAKSTLFEGGIHVPLIIAGAGVTRQGQRETALINTTDLFATIANLAGTGVKRSGDSISFKHLLVGEPGPKRSFIYAELHSTLSDKYNNGWTIRDNRYKLIQFEEPSRHSRLFDLNEDPFEETNLLKLDPTVKNQAIADGLTKAAEKLRQ
jgi:arylsulfatase A-like enzyme